MRDEIKMLFDVALQKRKDLVASFAGHTNAWRLVHSGADGFDGITVDHLNGVLLVEQHREHAEIQPLLIELQSRYEDMPIFVKKRWSANSDDRCGAQVAGPTTSSFLEIVENDLKFSVRLADDEHVGLFLDARSQRQWVRVNSIGKRVLNLFSYTGGFGVAAAAGGAKSTVNIDNKNSALRYAKENYEKNGLPFDNRSFFKCDVLYYLKRAAGQTGRFDLIVVDPPPRFKRRHQRDFQAHLDYGKLMTMCLGVLAPGGTVLAGLNALKASDEQFEEMIASAAMALNMPVDFAEELTADLDFPATEDRPVSRFRVLRFNTTRPMTVPE